MTQGNPAIPGSVSIPKNMHLQETNSTLNFDYSWFKLKYLVSLIAAPVFAYFLIKSTYIVGDFDHVTIPVILLSLIVLVIFYYSLARVLNTTRISVTHGDLKVSHGPMFFGRKVHLKKDDVTQLYVTRHRTGHRYYLLSETYQINVILKNKEVITLVRGLHRPEQGRFIENKIEEFLDITDMHVEGELEKD